VPIDQHVNVPPRDQYAPSTSSTFLSPPDPAGARPQWSIQKSWALIAAERIRVSSKEPARAVGPSGYRRVVDREEHANPWVDPGGRTPRLLLHRHRRHSQRGAHTRPRATMCRSRRLQEW